MSTAALSEADIESLEARTFEEESKVERPRERAKPRVFISPSLEGLEYARALEGYLEQFAIPQIWNEQQFELGRPILESLVRTVSKFDFAIVVFTTDDYVGIAKAKGFAGRTLRLRPVFLSDDSGFAEHSSWHLGMCQRAAFRAT